MTCRAVRAEVVVYPFRAWHARRGRGVGFAVAVKLRCENQVGRKKTSRPMLTTAEGD